MGISPVTALASVLFPEPLSPTTPRHLPDFKLRFIFSILGFFSPLNCFVRFFIIKISFIYAPKYIGKGFVKTKGKTKVYPKVESINSFVKSLLGEERTSFVFP